MNVSDVDQIRVRHTNTFAVASIQTEVDIITGYTNVAAVRVCDVPPGNPSGATTYCVDYEDLSLYIDGVCGSYGSGKPGSYLGVCGSNPCITNTTKK